VTTGSASFSNGRKAAQAPQALTLLPSCTLSGSWQMAIDAWMLNQRQNLLRLYRWSRPTLSLGHHQHRLEPRWLDLAARGAIELVRRPTGGRAVLHGGDLCYALVWPDAVGSRQQVYRQACGWLQQAFASLGQALEFGEQALSTQPSSCFALSTSADLMHRNGAKRIGSAQLWRRGCLLQHGSIQIAPPADLWQAVFGAPPPTLDALPVNGRELESILLESARAWLPTAAHGLMSGVVPSDALALIGLNTAEFQVERASPEATIALTTGASASPSG
jgi:lipoate-protein ligase A